MSSFEIARGTTPTISFTIRKKDGELLSFNDIILSSFRIYIKQERKNILIKREGSDVTVDAINSKVSTFLTQEETIAFKNDSVRAEVRWLFNSYLPNGEHVAGKTKITAVQTTNLIEDEVIR